MHGVHQALDGRTDTLWSRGRATSGPARGAGRVEEVDQMGALGLVELEGMGDAVDDALGDTGRIAAFEPDVVLR